MVLGKRARLKEQTEQYQTSPSNDCPFADHSSASCLEVKIRFRRRATLAQVATNKSKLWFATIEKQPPRQVSHRSCQSLVSSQSYDQNSFQQKGGFAGCHIDFNNRFVALSPR